MAGTSEIDYPYEASDEASESELLDRSLSVWKGWSSLETKDDFAPVYLDLHTASSIGQFDCVRTFIQRGEVDLNRKNHGGWTALMYACYIGHDNVVNLLLDAGVDVNVCNHKGQTPLMLASSCGNESVAYFLLQQGAEIEAKDKKGWTSLFHATYSGHQNMVKFLLDSGANIEAREPSKEYTPFMLAAAEGHEIIVQIFLHYGVSVHAKACNGDMGRSLALMYGHMKIVSLIDNYSVPTHSVRSEAGLNVEGDLSSSDEAYRMCPRPKHHNPRVQRTKVKGPSIRDGPEAFAKLIDKKDHHHQHHPQHQHHHNNHHRHGQQQQQPQQQRAHKTVAPPAHVQHAQYPKSVVPHGYVSFDQDGGNPAADGEIRFRDVISPIDPEDHTLDSSGSRESHNNEEDDGNAFSKTGAITIKSSSSSSGGLVAALGISRDNSLDSNEDPLFVPSQQPDDDNNSNSQLQQTSKPLTTKQQDVSSYPPAKNEISETQATTSQQPAAKHVNTAESTSTIASVCDSDTNSTQSAVKSSLVKLDSNCEVTRESCASPGQQRGAKHKSKEEQSNCTSANHADIPQVKTLNTPSEPKYSSGSKEVCHNPRTVNDTVDPADQRPCSLPALLTEIGLTKYIALFEEQDVDLQVFLSLTDNDLKEVGIKLFGPRRKMTNAIARWHSNAPHASNSAEQAYADRLESEMQEMAIQLHQANLQAEQYSKQVLQERELRSVTEGWLMEDKAALQHIHTLATNTHTQCNDALELLQSIRVYQAEVCRRFSGDDPFSMATPYNYQNETALSKAFQEGMLISQNSEPLSNMPTQHLLSQMQACLDELYQNVHITASNTDKLLGRDEIYWSQSEDNYP